MITDHSIYMVYGAPQTNLTQGSGGGGGGGGGGEAQGSRGGGGTGIKFNI